MKYFENILGTIGNTPLVKLNRLTKELPCLVLAKYETFNPGNSTKDRMALKMIEDAEHQGLLKKGGTIIEGTSGNTGMGLALAAIVKGYNCIFVLTDKQSKEKMDILRAVGAEVVVCPTDVSPEDPRSYYSVAKRLSEEKSKVGSAGLVMAIVGGALMPKLQGIIIDVGGNGVADTTIMGVSEVNFSFILPLLCFAYIAWYGFTVFKKYESKVTPIS